MAETMHACWVAFAFYDGKGPLDCKNGLIWPAYTPETDQLMEFGKDSGVRTHFMKTEWDKELSAPPQPRRRSR